METYKMTLDEFTKDLASDSSAPGGGAVAAISGALAACLTSMVINLTVNKKKFNEYSDEIKSKFNEYLERCQELRKYFLEDIDRDIVAFNDVMAAYKMPKNTEEEKIERHNAIQRALTEAYRVPYSVLENANSMFEMVKFVAEYGNENLITDAGIAAIQLYAAIESSILNVKINLASIDDIDMVNEINLYCKKFLIEASKNKEEILNMVYKKI